MRFEKWILGSRSPRRRELLSQLVPETQIEVVPPQDSEEAGFENFHELNSIREQLASICSHKNNDVFEQIDGTMAQGCLLLTADTVIVVEREPGFFSVLGKPPVDADWQKVVQDWFLQDYAGRTHWVITGLCVRTHRSLITEFSQTLVSFHEREQVLEHLDWYLSTEESVGKAGGYAVQGAGSIFVKQIEGSLSNVVGLPLEKLVPFVS